MRPSRTVTPFLLCCLRFSQPVWARRGLALLLLGGLPLAACDRVPLDPFEDGTPAPHESDNLVVERFAKLGPDQHMAACR